MKDLRKYHPYTSNPPAFKRNVTCLPEEEEAIMKRFEAQGMRLFKRTRCANVERGRAGVRLVFLSQK